jgi:hypothetical protein
MAFGKVHSVTETHNFTQKIGPVTEAFENAGHLLAARLAPPFVVGFGDVAGSVRVFDKADFCFWMSHGLQQKPALLEESSTP